MNKKTVRIGLAGGTGQMSQQIYRALLQDQNMELGLLVARDLEKWHSMYSLQVDREDEVIFTSHLLSHLPNCEVMIDFTHPDMVPRYVEHLQQHQIPLLIGTSGLVEHRHFALIESLSQTVPVLYSRNISTGMNMLFYMVRKIAARLSPEYHAEVLDIHHRLKKDAPSATAKQLAATVAEERETSFGILSSIVENVDVSRASTDIGIQALRMGYGVGEHSVFFAGEGERIELTHRVFNREPIARLALKAANWVMQQKPGMYSMADMLGLQD